MPDVRRLALRRRRDRDVRRGLDVRFAGRAIERGDVVLDLGIARERLGDPDLLEREVVAGRRHHGRLRGELGRARRRAGRALPCFCSTNFGSAILVGGKLREVGVERRELLVELRRSSPPLRPGRSRRRTAAGAAHGDVSFETTWPRFAGITSQPSPTFCGSISTRSGSGAASPRPADREIDAADVAHELDRVLLVRRLHQADHDLRALLAKLGHRGLAGGDGVGDREPGDRVLGDHAEHADLRGPDVDHVRRLDRELGVRGDVDRLARGAHVVGAAGEVRGSEADRGDLQRFLVESRAGGRP